jgi:hypothetical protein
MTNHEITDDEMTLDPPGRIVVIGGGPLGIEAALYGRFLGYEVTVYEKGVVGQTLLSLGEAPLPMLPDRCLSPLAVSALQAQDKGVILPTDPRYPTTVRQWVENGLQRIAATDLLLNRVQTGHEVIALRHIDVDVAASVADFEEDADEYIDGEVPPDFELTISHCNGTERARAEAVMVATGACSFCPNGWDDVASSPYLFRLGDTMRLPDARSESDEEALHRGWHEIVSIYARLGGRMNLDLYRPLRS